MSKTTIDDTTKYLCDNCGTVFWIKPSELEGCPSCGVIHARKTDQIVAVQHFDQNSGDNQLS